MSSVAVVAAALMLVLALAVALWTPGTRGPINERAEAPSLAAKRDLRTGPSPPDTRIRLGRIHEADRPLEIDHVEGSDAMRRLLTRLLHEIATIENARPPPRPRAPTALLLEGPSGVAMPTLAHLLKDHFHARLVHLLASMAIPATNGGSQPLLAECIGRARHHRPSVLFIDELETVAAREILSATRKRAAHDLLNEALRPSYTPSFIVLAAFTTDHSTGLRPAVSRRFRHHPISVDVPQFERGMMQQAMTATHDPIFDILSVRRLLERVDVRRDGSICEAA